jgi:hypothetical protein
VTPVATSIPEVRDQYQESPSITRTLQYPPPKVTPPVCPPAVFQTYQQTIDTQLACQARDMQNRIDALSEQITATNLSTKNQFEMFQQSMSQSFSEAMSQIADRLPPPENKEPMRKKQQVTNTDQQSSSHSNHVSGQGRVGQYSPGRDTSGDGFQERRGTTGPSAMES